MDKKFQIKVDFREQFSSCFDELYQSPDFDIEITSLSSGDYIIRGLIFERKTLNDLARSIIDGRLFKQAQRLAIKKHAILLIEGDFNDIDKLGVDKAAIQGALITINLIFGIPILYALNGEEAARLIRYTVNQKIQFNAKGIKRFGYHPKTLYRRQLYIIQGLPGIGLKRAKHLLQQFGSVRSVFNATIEDLQTVDGIGKKTAKSIYQLLNIVNDP